VVLSFCQSVILSAFSKCNATYHPIDFVFDPRVGFSGTADRMDLLPVGPNPGGRPPPLKISNDHISRVGYPIHFHELESSVGGI